MALFCTKRTREDLIAGNADFNVMQRRRAYNPGQPIAPREGWQVFDAKLSYAALIERLGAAVRAEKNGPR